MGVELFADQGGGRMLADQLIEAGVQFGEAVRQGRVPVEPNHAGLDQPGVAASTGGVEQGVTRSFQTGVYADNAESSGQILSRGRRDAPPCEYVPMMRTFG